MISDSVRSDLCFVIRWQKEKTNLFDFLFLLLQNLTRWGGVLLELSQFHSISDAKQMIQGSLKLYSVLI